MTIPLTQGVPGKLLKIYNITNKLTVYTPHIIAKTKVNIFCLHLLERYQFYFFQQLHNRHFFKSKKPTISFCHLLA